MFHSKSMFWTTTMAFVSFVVKDFTFTFTSLLDLEIRYVYSLDSLPLIKKSFFCKSTRNGFFLSKYALI